jgi:hypothetical protein
MKKILGSIFLVAIFFINLQAGVKASISAPAIYKGESVNFAITADGDDIEFPEIDMIDIYNINGTSSSQSTRIINGDISKQVSKVYSFTPKKSVVIPSYDVKVDGKVYKTQELKVEVLKPSANTQGDDFILEMSVDKKEARVGESINLIVSFKQKLGAKAHDIKLGEPKLENFWIKKAEGVEKVSEGEYIVQKLHYVLFPQKAGNYTLEPVEGAIGKVVQSRGRGFGGGMFDDPFFNDPFFNSLTNRVRWTKLFSNDIELNIKPLPDNLELYGDFKIDAKVDKIKVNVNKPVNLTIKVTGFGNIDDIKKFEPQIDNAIIYADEPKITTNIKNGKYGGEFTQKIAIIADSNFTIPSISLEYFDRDKNSTNIIKTEPFDIVVKGATAIKEMPKIESSYKKVPAEKDSSKELRLKSEPDHVKYLFLLLGTVIGMILTTGFNFLKNRSKKVESDIVKKIKKAKNDRELFDILLPFSQKGELISSTLEKLENNLYRNGNQKIDKNKLMDFFEDIEEI